jgi:hypothetical protein
MQNNCTLNPCPRWKVQFKKADMFFSASYDQIYDMLGALLRASNAGFKTRVFLIRY